MSASRIRLDRVMAIAAVAVLLGGGFTRPAYAAHWSYGGTADMPKMGYGEEEYETWFTCSPRRKQVEVIAETDTPSGQRGTLTLTSSTGSLRISGIVTGEMADYVSGKVPYSRAAAFFKATNGSVMKNTNRSRATLPGTGLGRAFATFRKVCRL